MGNDYTQVDWSTVQTPKLTHGTIPGSPMPYPLINRVDLALWHITGQMMAAGKEPEAAAALAKRAVKAMYPGVETYSL